MPETVLAVDFGLKHIGLAVGQTISRTASPIGVIAAKDGRPDWAAFDAAVREWAAGAPAGGLAHPHGRL